MQDCFHALGQLQVFDVHGVAEHHVLEVDLDKLGQVRRQATNQQIAHHVADDTARQFHPRRELGVDKVQRHFHLDFHLGQDALEIDVLDLHPERVHVDCPQQHLLLRALEIERQHGGVESLLAQLVVQRVMIELDDHRRLIAPVDDAGGLAFTAQAAARSGALLAALLRVDFDLHVALLVMAVPRPGTAV